MGCRYRSQSTFLQRPIGSLILQPANLSIEDQQEVTSTTRREICTYCGSTDKGIQLVKLLDKAESLIGYNSSNIFRIWIPNEKKVIVTRDVTLTKQ